MFTEVKKSWSGVDVTDFDPYHSALQARLINRIWNDEQLKQEILSNPKAVLERETKVKFPEDMEVKVLEEDDGSNFYLVIPSLPTTKARWEQFYMQMSVWWTLTYTWAWWMYRNEGEKSQAFRESLEALIIVQFMQDEDLRTELFDNPKKALKKQAGVTIPEGIKVQPLQENPKLAYFVLPRNPQTENLPHLDSEEDKALWWMAAHTWFWWLASLPIKVQDMKTAS